MQGGLYSAENSLLLVGDAKALAEFAGDLRRGGPQRLELEPADDGYTSPVKELRVEVGASDIAHLEVRGAIAFLKGSRGACIHVAEEIELFLEHNDLTEPGMHTHIGEQQSLGRDYVVLRGLELFLAGPVD